MHQHIVDSMIPYDASGNFGVKVMGTGNVPTPTPTGYMVYDNGLKVFTGSAWTSLAGSSSYLAGTGLNLSGTTFNVLSASTSVTGVVILTNTIDASQSKALTPKAVNDAGFLTSHPSITAASSSDNSGRTYIQDLLFDANGHVTGVSTATETVTDTTYTAASGVELNGTQFSVSSSVVQSGNNISLLINDSGYLNAHPTVSAASSSDNSGRTYIQDLLLDSNGHVTGVSTATETVSDTTYTAGTGLALNGTEFYTSGDGDFNSLVIASGITLSNNVPSVTTSKIYNNGGSLYFDGSPVGGGGGGADWTVADGLGNSEAISSGETVYFSGISPTVVTFDGATNIVSISGSDTTYTAGTGLALNGSEFSTANTGSFDKLVVNTGVSDYHLDVGGSGQIGDIFRTKKAVKTAIKSNADGETITFDLNESNTHYATLGGNRTIALSNPDVGQKFILRLQQDNTGGRTVTWFSTIKWDGVTPPTLSTSGNRADLFGFLCTSGGQYDGMVLAQNLG